MWMAKWARSRSTQDQKNICTKQVPLPDNVSPQLLLKAPTTSTLTCTHKTSENFKYSWFVTGTTSKVVWTDCWDTSLILILQIKLVDLKADPWTVT